MKDYAAFISLDWADKKHDGCIIEKPNDKPKHFILKHSAESLDDWALALRKRFQGRKIALILEQSKGALIYALMKYDFIELFPINPATLAKYREAFAPSGAKDDPTDAKFLLEILLKHRDKLKSWKPDTEQTRMLQQLVHQRRVLVDDRKRIGNRLTSFLKCYYPQVLELFPKMGRLVLCEFILKYPTLEQAKLASEKEIIAFFRKHRSGHSSLLQKRIDIIKNSSPLTTDKAIIDSHSMMACAISKQIIAIVECIQLFDKQIEDIFTKHEDAHIFNSLPAAGEHLAPRLLAAMGTDRSRFNSAAEVQQLMGIAPVIERSGQHTWIRWRYSCNKFLRQSFQEWAGVTIKYSLWARAYYAMQRQKGKSHPMAVRALAFKWIRIIFKLWKENKSYSEALHLQQLQRSGSPIFAFLAQNPNLENIKFSST